jgi:hypothetical protein
VNIDIRDAVGRAIQKMDKFFKWMDDNILHYVASVLDPRIKTSFIEAHMGDQDAQLIISQVREFLKKEYPFQPVLLSQPKRPSGMSEVMWKILQKVQPSRETPISDIDRYMDSPPASWSYHSIEDGDPQWVLKWWRLNSFDYPLMAQAVRDFLPVPAAEVGVEREFSGARDVLGIRRHSMNAETMRWLMLLKRSFRKPS